MAFLNRTQVKKVVVNSLKAIADVPANVEAATFQMLNDQQDHVFLSTLKSKLNGLPYYMNNGTTNHLAYYDVDLKPDSIDDWATVGDCIDWVTANQKVVYL